MMLKKMSLIAVIAIYACGGPAYEIPDDVEWTITSEEPNKAFSKNNVEVQLNKRVSEEILRAVAQEIRSERYEYDNLWIFHRLEGVEGGLAWATTHYNPDLTVKIIGSTEEDSEQAAANSEVEGEVLGRWTSEKSLQGGMLTLYRNTDDKLTMRTVFKESSPMDAIVKELKEGGKTKYDDRNSHGEYYVLESNGNLGMYSSDGKFDEASKIK